MQLRLLTLFNGFDGLLNANNGWSRNYKKIKNING